MRPSRRRWLIGAPALFLVLAVAALYVWRTRAGAAPCAPPHDPWTHEPGVIAATNLSGGVAGFDLESRLFSDGRFVATRHGKTTFSGPAAEAEPSLERLVVLAREVSLDLHPLVGGCPPQESDPMWSGAAFHGQGKRTPTAAERAEIDALLAKANQVAWRIGERWPSPNDGGRAD